MIEFLSQIDTQVFLFFNSFHTPALDQFMMLLSHRMVWVPMYIMIFAMVVHRYGLPAGIIVALGVALTVTLADQTCATLIRPFVQRLRPANPDNPISDLVHIVWGYRGGSYGFPSCHAANTFAVATYLSYVFRHRRLAVVSLFAWAAFNCYSRVYLGVHYPGDILVGAVIGAFMGYIVHRITNLAVIWILRHPLKSNRNRVHISFGSGMPELHMSNESLICATGVLTTTVLLFISLFAYFV